ncbi:MAG: hypothetical protein RLZZ63_357 [Gemmatimonadota bacterium]
MDNAGLETRPDGRGQVRGVRGQETTYAWTVLVVFKLPVGLLCASALTFTVGTWNEGGVGRVAEAATQSSRASQAGDAPLQGSLEVQVGEGVDLDFVITHQADERLELSFRDGQTHEVVILDASGTPVWHWSEGRRFTRAMQQRVLRHGDQLAFRERWIPSKPGAYIAVATLRSREHPITERVAFVVPAG